MRVQLPIFRMLVGGVIGLVLGLVGVVTTILRWEVRSKLMDMVSSQGDASSSLVLTPFILLFAVAGALAGALTRLRYTWLAYTLSGMLIGAVSGAFLHVAHPFLRTYQPPAWSFLDEVGFVARSAG